MLGNFGSISGTPSFDIEFVLEGQMQGQSHDPVSYLLRLAIVGDHFGARADVISGSYPVSFDIEFDLEVKCQVKYHGRVSCALRLAIV